MSFSYLVALGDDKNLTLDQEFVDKLTRYNPCLRGLRTERIDASLRIRVRVAGLTRWHIQREAPRILGIILRKNKIPLASATFESMIMEPGRSHLKNGQGRTEMTRRPRAERMADGRRWDHIEWEGDDFTDASSPPSGSP